MLLPRTSLVSHQLCVRIFPTSKEIGALIDVLSETPCIFFLVLWIVFCSYCMELPSSTYYLHAQYSLLVKRASLQRVVSLPDARYPCSLSCKRCPIPMMASVVCYSLKRSKIDLTRGQLRWDDFINSSCYEMKQYAFEECKKVDFRYDNTYY